MKEKIKNFVANHEETISAVAGGVGAVTCYCGILTIWMVIWKKLGFYN